MGDNAPSNVVGMLSTLFFSASELSLMHRYVAVTLVLSSMGREVAVGRGIPPPVTKKIMKYIFDSHHQLNIHTFFHH